MPECTLCGRPGATHISINDLPYCNPQCEAADNPAPERLHPETEHLARGIAAREAAEPFHLSDCEGELKVWWESVLRHVTRDPSTGEITGFSPPSSYPPAAQVIDIALDTWDPGEVETDDQRREQITDLVTARRLVGMLLTEIDALRAEKEGLSETARLSNQTAIKACEERDARPRRSAVLREIAKDARQWASCQIEDLAMGRYAEELNQRAEAASSQEGGSR
ncbi:hypothetical protein [Streptomyces nanshensis]|uniref:Uncharacterized protein n=1 Tax=Streptomyces nanshensis TaxID=518642 RepID=A0A1E7LCW0_9ACTN|nr:hypothetical protein [Streptomyces nanshensis]OEV14059.1 hypothetical protein AN218_00865 [Streptomyces nanshensis]